MNSKMIDSAFAEQQYQKNIRQKLLNHSLPVLCLSCGEDNFRKLVSTQITAIAWCNTCEINNTWYTPKENVISYGAQQKTSKDNVFINYFSKSNTTHVYRYFTKSNTTHVYRILDTLITSEIKVDGYVTLNKIYRLQNFY